MTQTHKEILPGVFLRSIQTQKFKSSFFSISLTVPLSMETASANALIPEVLRRGTTKYPDMQSISSALDDLYGGYIDGAVRKRAESQSVGFVGSFVDDAYTPDKTPLIEPATALMGELLFSPVTKNGVFLEEYVQGERTNLVQRLKSNVNNKRYYASSQLTKLMCKDEAYGVDRLGSEETAEKVTPESLWAQYQTLLRTAQINIYFCGSAAPERVEKAMLAMLAPLPERGELVTCGCEVRVATGENPAFHSESMDVTQGKLVMGFRTGGVTVLSEEYPAMVLGIAIFGGTSMSKLFMNVREKLSLCYYAGAMMERNKGVMIVSSGIEFEKFDQAKEEILAQLEAVKQGDVTTEELEGTRRILMGNLRTISDEQGNLEDYWFSQSVGNMNFGPEDFCKMIEKVTLEEAVAAVNHVKLDTVYFLKGLED